MRIVQMTERARCARLHVMEGLLMLQTRSLQRPDLRRTLCHLLLPRRLRPLWLLQCNSTCAS